jgi:hypothetical protein
MPDGTCAQYTLKDKTNLTYQFVKYVPCSTYLGGFCLPKGEMEALIAWGRQEIKSCQSQNQQ